MLRQVYAHVSRSRRFSVSSSSSSGDSDSDYGDYRHRPPQQPSSRRQMSANNHQFEQYQGRRRSIQHLPDAAGSSPALFAPQRMQVAQTLASNVGGMHNQISFNTNYQNSIEAVTPSQVLDDQRPPPPSPKEIDINRRWRDHRTDSGVLRTAVTAIIMVLATAAYSILGGLMFSYLEQSNERAECVELRYLYEKTRNATAFNLYDVFSSPQLDEQQKLEAFLPVLDTMRSSIQNISWDGRNCEHMSMKWSLAGASFFAFTTVSAIGYGNIAPRTNWGRMVCIAYSIVGLPLMLVTLAKVGAVFAYYFRWFYFKVLCCGICIQRRRAQLRRRKSLGSRQQFRWKFDEHGNQRLDSGKSQLIEDISSDEEERPSASLGANIPVLLSLSVAALMILIGILVYIPTESWSASDAAYFSFVSLGTIGLGDLMPGYSPITGQTDEYRMCVTSAYIFFGMAILSMALQMMQDEVIEKFHWLITKMKRCCRKKGADDAKNRAGPGHHAEGTRKGHNAPPSPSRLASGPSSTQHGAGQHDSPWFTDQTFVAQRY